MNTITLRLNGKTKSFVDEETTERGFDSAEEYIQALLSDARKQKAKAKLEAMLLEGLDSPTITVTPEWWKKFRAGVIKRHRARKKHQSSKG